MWRLSYNDLVNAYTKAKELNLDSRFIQQLEKELKERSINKRLIKRK